MALQLLPHREAFTSVLDFLPISVFELQAHTQQPDCQTDRETDK